MWQAVWHQDCVPPGTENSEWTCYLVLLSLSSIYNVHCFSIAGGFAVLAWVGVCSWRHQRHQSPHWTPSTSPAWGAALHHIQSWACMECRFYVHLSMPAQLILSPLSVCHSVYTCTCAISNLQVYLVDYGLAYRYRPQGQQKEYKEDPRRKHDGTLEFTSIDAHKGVSECIF